MKRALTWLVWAGPVALFGYVAVATILNNLTTDARLPDANGLGWGQGDDAIKVAVTRIQEGENLRFRIEATRADGRTVLQRDFDVNLDMWGDGFVRGIQADADPELEVAAWGHYEQDSSSFWLDYNGGVVRERPFTEASDEARALAREWHQAHRMDVAGLVPLSMLCVGYYLLAAVMWWIVQAVRRARHGRAGGTQAG